jgi:NAD(P)-dependent dehydrogenase (short-subunit alcohol dehydrogenase family)
MPTLLVFGARHLGRTIAGHFARNGWNVAAVARSEETLERVRSELPDGLAIAADASSAADVERAFAETQGRFGGVDLVVVAISVGVPGGPLTEAAHDALAPYLEQLVPAVFNVLREGGRVLGAAGSGTIVQITGGSARRGMAGRGPWAAAAFASRALTQAAALELREQGVHVALLVVDATIASEKTAAWIEGKPEDATATEDDVAAAVAYLASQSPRGWTHELQITPRLDRWVP